MTNPNPRKAAMQAYFDAFNAGDLAAIVALYADDATVEDPVGSEPVRGRAAIEQFYRHALATGAKLGADGTIRGSHGDAAAMPFIVNVAMQGHKVCIRVVDVMRFDAAGKVTSMQAYWGMDDVAPAAG